MINQTEQFLNGEGDNWYERNKHAKPNPIVLDAILALPTRPARYMEVGCGNGRYIGELHRRIGGRVYGVDPSAKAIAAAREAYPNVIFNRGDVFTGLTLGCPLDLVVFGFCLYIANRHDLFEIAAETDEALDRGGYIAIHDFLPERPEKVPYKHVNGMFSYKMDYASLWLANPAYREVSCTPTAPGEAIKIIQKVGW